MPPWRSAPRSRSMVRTLTSNAVPARLRCEPGGRPTAAPPPRRTTGQSGSHATSTTVSIPISDHAMPLPHSCSFISLERPKRVLVPFACPISGSGGRQRSLVVFTSAHPGNLGASPKEHDG